MMYICVSCVWQPGDLYTIKKGSIAVKTSASLFLSTALQLALVPHSDAHADPLLPFSEPLALFPSKQVMHALRSIGQLSRLWQLAVHLVHASESILRGFQRLVWESRWKWRIKFKPIWIFSVVRRGQCSQESRDTVYGPPSIFVNR